VQVFFGGFEVGIDAGGSYLSAGAATDQSHVYEGALGAVEVADGNFGGIDVNEAVEARNFVVFWYVWKPDGTVVLSADPAGH
jgi:hypothetical protein